LTIPATVAFPSSPTRLSNLRSCPATTGSSRIGSMKRKQPRNAKRWRMRTLSTAEAYRAHSHTLLGLFSLTHIEGIATCVVSTLAYGHVHRFPTFSALTCHTLCSSSIATLLFSSTAGTGASSLMFTSTATSTSTRSCTCRTTTRHMVRYP
jgi:hypothetical protein